MTARALTRPIARRPVRNSLGVDPVAAAVQAALVAHFPMTGGTAARVGTGSLTVTRASQACGGNGTTEPLVVVGNNEPRYLHGRLLCEESRTNQCPYSTNTGAGGWNGSGITFDYTAIEAAKGLASASKITFASDTGADYAGAVFAVSGTAAGCGSVYVMGDSDSAGKTVDIALYDVTAASLIAVATWTLTDSPQRIYVNGGSTTATNTIVLAVGNLDAFGGSSNLTIGDVVYMDGIQYEEGENPTSLIITSGAAATRLMDVPTVDVANMPSYSADYSIALTLYPYDGSSGGHGLYSIDGETTRRAIIDASDHKLYTVHPNATASTNVMPHSQSLRIVTSVDVAGNVNTYVNRSLESTTAAAAFSGTATAFYVGAYVGGTQSAHGLLSDLKTYSKALSATEALYA